VKIETTKAYILTSKTSENRLTRCASLTDKSLGTVPQFVDFIAFSTKRKVANGCNAHRYTV